MYNNFGTIIESPILPAGGEVDIEIDDISELQDLLFFVNSSMAQVELLINKYDGQNWLASYQSIGILGAVGIGTNGFIEQMWGGFFGEKIKIKLRNIDAVNTNVKVTLQGKSM